MSAGLIYRPALARYDRERREKRHESTGSQGDSVMPPDRWLLVVSLVLQSAVSLIFGLAFLGLWKGFHRPTAVRWAVAWLVYDDGGIFGALGIGLGFAAGFPPLGRALLVLPIQFGVRLFRAGTDSLV